MAEETKKIWVNTQMDEETLSKLDEMVTENGSTRAAFVRLLVDNEYKSRQAMKKVLARVKNVNAAV
jgi:hypothetical protein